MARTGSLKCPTSCTHMPTCPTGGVQRAAWRPAAACRPQRCAGGRLCSLPARQRVLEETSWLTLLLLLRRRQSRQRVQAASALDVQAPAQSDTYSTPEEFRKLYTAKGA